MTTKTVELLLVYTTMFNAKTGNNDPAYVVKRTKNTTEYIPGNYLAKVEVDMLIARRNWSITVVGE